MWQHDLVSCLSCRVVIKSDINEPTSKRNLWATHHYSMQYTLGFRRPCIINTLNTIQTMWIKLSFFYLFCINTKQMEERQLHSHNSADMIIYKRLFTNEECTCTCIDTSCVDWLSFDLGCMLLSTNWTDYKIQGKTR